MSWLHKKWIWHSLKGELKKANENSTEYDQILKYSVYWLVISIVSSRGWHRLQFLWLLIFQKKFASLAHLLFAFCGFWYLIKKYGSPIERGTHLLIDINPSPSFQNEWVLSFLLLNAVIWWFGRAWGTSRTAALIDHLSHILKISEDNRN